MLRDLERRRGRRRRQRSGGAGLADGGGGSGGGEGMSLDWARSVVHPRHAGAWREGPLALLLAASKGYIKHIYIYTYMYIYYD